MKYYVCSIKGLIDSDQCFDCFRQQEDKVDRAASRVLCKVDRLSSPNCFAEKFGQAGCDNCLPKIRKLCVEKTEQLEAASKVQKVEVEQKVVKQERRASGGRKAEIIEILRETPMSQKVLAELLGIKVSTCWVAVNNMMKKGLLEREKVGGGKKASYIYTVS